MDSDLLRATTFHPLDRRAFNREFNAWHQRYLAPGATGTKCLHPEDILGAHPDLRMTRAERWIEDELMRCEECLCLFVGKSQEMARVVHPSLPAITEAARHRDCFLIGADGSWTAAVSGSAEWGPFVVFQPSDT